ncbi:MAG: hypothetical protein FWD78_05535 [Treponema sp.]|nr:hypothetical protein [Treponema sp.]
MRGAGPECRQTRGMYTYDNNGNLASKTSPWGTIAYTYNNENQLIKKGNITYTYDREGNLTEENDRVTKTVYSYNGNNRMISVVKTDIKKNQVTSRADYDYNGLGRRTITKFDSKSPIRTVYDGTGFEKVILIFLIISGLFINS